MNTNKLNKNLETLTDQELEINGGGFWGKVGEFVGYGGASSNAQKHAFCDKYYAPRTNARANCYSMYEQ
ncbi:TPA: hypothetical protein QC285_005866 [Bacillus cereus]|uniref:Uncharacterized protein n=1 Tax=Bacillus thuringiensis TaxID=1428 RepID=B0FXS5_BACTU|nr:MULTISPECIES: hypothetical protein [Bacillus]ABY68474.1 hypothetical protein pFR12.5_04 [Bacillus thuringiensis]MCU5320991.1 hypothetical protein [Bacillus cereus]MCU5572640.1 hypothetical protein [Bacillus cereus]MEB9946159.1 hypothetical protein [Bacillus cereus]NIL30543.1 hypothetical protein [Bacillus thuringiensis]